jgi:PAS domain S-box-containing protein
MDIREQTRLILTGVIISVIIVIMVISFTVFLDNYRKIETGYVTDYSNLVDQNVKNEIYSLDVTVKDWGPWDDTYAFVTGEKEDYIKVNLGATTFQNLDLNFIIITNTQGDVVYGQGFDRETRKLTPLRSDVVEELARKDSPFHNMNLESRSSGLLNLPQGLVLISTYPIVHSDFSGPPRGVVIIGRYLGEKDFAKLSLATRAKVSIISLEQAPLSDSDKALLSSSDISPVIIRQLNEETIEGDMAIPDATGKNKFLIRIQIPRDIYNQGKMDILNYTLIILGLQLLEGLLIIWLLDRQVLSRLISMNTQIENITKRRDGASRVNSTGNDEISHLTVTLNRMLDQIDQDQLVLQNSEKRFREFAEHFPEIMMELDPQGVPLFVNNATYEKFGYNPGELESVSSIINLLAPEEHARITNDFSRVFQGETLSGSEYMALKKDGSRFPLLLYSAPAIRDGKRSGIWIFAGDISDRKKMENTLLEMNRKINLLNSVTRHDVDNQLTALFGFTELIEESVLDPQIQSYINFQKRAAETIQKQMAFTKDYQGLGVKAPLWQNVRRVILNANGNHDISKIAITIDIHDIEIYADLLLEKVFFNLVDNVNRHGVNVTTLWMYGKETAEGFVIIVEDNGVGIPYEKKEGIFTRQYFTNTGFGLFLSREILAITGITIKETGEPDQGARFEILVPKGMYRFSKTFETDGTSGNC